MGFLPESGAYSSAVRSESLSGNTKRNIPRKKELPGRVTPDTDCPNRSERRCVPSGTDRSLN